MKVLGNTQGMRSSGSFIEHLLLSWKMIKSKEDNNKVKRKDEIEPSADYVDKR
jgi:hypothetical protein